MCLFANRYQGELTSVKKSVDKVHRSINSLNNTIHSFHTKRTPELASKVSDLRNDLETVKTGMADTGADIEKLRANGKSVVHNIRVLRKKIDTVNRQLYNMTVKVSLLENEAPPPFVAPTTTPKMLVVTITPDLDQPVSRRQLNKMLTELETKQTDHCTKEVAAYDERLKLLQNQTHMMDVTYANEVSAFRKFMASFQHTTSSPLTTLHSVMKNVSHAVNNATVSMNSTAVPMKKKLPTTIATTTTNNNKNSNNKNNNKNTSVQNKNNSTNANAKKVQNDTLIKPVVNATSTSGNITRTLTNNTKQISTVKKQSSVVTNVVKETALPTNNGSAVPAGGNKTKANGAG